MEREAFLGRLRDRLAGELAVNLSHPIEAVVEIPEIGHPRRNDNPRELFAETAAARGWNVRAVASRAELDAVIQEVCELESVKRALLSREPEAAQTAAALRAQGVELLEWRRPGDTGAADLGVTGAAYALATTGSVVVSSTRAGGRAASLLPSTHLALVPASRILASPSALWRHLPERFPEGLPSQLVFITGPSRSADIEFTLTVGVHGPKRVWVVILEDR